MADMRVKMFLDLVSNTKGGAAKAKRELKGVKDAARDLNRQEAGKRITRDIMSISSKAPAAARRLREVKTAAKGLGADKHIAEDGIGVKVEFSVKLAPFGGEAAFGGLF